MTIRAVFFDFGGVLGRFDRVGVREMEERFGLPDGAVVTAFYRIPEWEQVAIGRLPEPDWLDAVGRKLDELAGRAIPEIRDEWAGAWSNVDRDVIGLAAGLRGRYRIGVLSNSTPRLETELLAANGIHDMWDVNHQFGSRRRRQTRQPHLSNRRRADWRSARSLSPHRRSRAQRSWRRGGRLQCHSPPGRFR